MSAGDRPRFPAGEAPKRLVRFVVIFSLHPIIYSLKNLRLSCWALSTFPASASF